MSIEDNLNAQNEEEIIAQIREAKTTLHAVKLLRHILEFKHASVYYLKQHTKPSLIPFIKTTYPKSWIVRYMFKQYGAKDPVLKHVARHVKPYYWSDFPEFRDPKNSFYKDVLAHGLGNDGYCIPVHSTPNRFSLIILSSETPTDDFKKKIGKLDELLQKIATELHLKAIKESAL